MFLKRHVKFKSIIHHTAIAIYPACSNISLSCMSVVCNIQYIQARTKAKQNISLIIKFIGRLRCLSLTPNTRTAQQRTRTHIWSLAWWCVCVPDNTSVLLSCCSQMLMNATNQILWNCVYITVYMRLRRYREYKSIQKKTISSTQQLNNDPNQANTTQTHRIIIFDIDNHYPAFWHSTPKWIF